MGASRHPNATEAATPAPRGQREPSVESSGVARQLLMGLSSTVLRILGRWLAPASLDAGVYLAARGSVSPGLRCVGSIQSICPLVHMSWAENPPRAQTG